MPKGVQKITYDAYPEEWTSIIERVSNPEYHVYAIKTADIQSVKNMNTGKHEYYVMVGDLKCIIANNDLKYLEEFMKAPSGIIQKKKSFWRANTILVTLCNVYWSYPLKRYVGVFVSSE